MLVIFEASRAIIFHTANILINADNGENKFQKLSQEYLPLLNSEHVEM